MDPLSITAASFSIAGAVAKASVAIFEFSQHAKDAAEDLGRVNSELHALTSILDPLARRLSKATPDGTVSAGLAQQLESSLEGCASVLGQLQDLIKKYQREGAWTRTKWVMLGRGDVEKLRESLEAYKMALSLGLHVISMAIEENIQRDTSVLRNDTRALQEYASDIKINTDEILARVNSICHGRYNRASSSRVQQWIDEIEILTSYAETTSQGTTVRLEDLDSPGNPDEGRETPVGEAGSDEEHEDTLSDVGRPHTPAKTTQMPKPTGEFRPAEGGRLDLVVSIDIGDTSTAVAWMTRNTQIQIISAWPGGSGMRVPTSVAYGAQGELSSWGFQCAGHSHSNPSLTALMDDANENPTSHVSPRENSRRLADFLQRLYGHVKEVISSALDAQQQAWAEMGIEFHFTLPDAFRWARVLSRERFTNTLKDILREVGIGTARHHYAILGFTQTEAASIIALKRQRPRAPNELLVFLSEGCAALLGSNQSAIGIDEAFIGSVRCLPRFEDVFAEYVLERLRAFPGVKGRLGSGVARELVRGTDFRAITSVVDGRAPQRGSYTLGADGIPPSFRHEDLAIADGAIQFTHDQVELVRRRQFRRAVDAVETFIGMFPVLAREEGAYHGVYSRIIVVSKEVTRMTQYIAEMLPLTQKLSGRDQITTSTLGDQASPGAAVRGAIIRRGAWAWWLSQADRLINFLGENPRLFVWPREPSGLLRPVRGGWHTWKLRPTSGGKTMIKFSTEPGRPVTAVCLYLDVFYTFDSDQVSPLYDPGSAETAGDGGLRRLCTIQAMIREDRFRAQKPRNKRYRSGKAVSKVFVSLEPFTRKVGWAGPEARVSAGGRFPPDVKCKTDVTWYSEPPHIVWQREYAPPPTEGMPRV